MSKLTPKMQERLEKWQKKILPVKNGEKIKKPWEQKLRAVSRDYADDLSDFEAEFFKKNQPRVEQ